MPENDAPRKFRIPYGGLTELAQRLGVTPGHLSHYLKGRRPSRRLDHAFVELFGVTGAEVAASHRADDEKGEQGEPGEAAA